jgi:hypothetical protein
MGPHTRYTAPGFPRLKSQKDTFVAKLNQQADSSADSSGSLGSWIQFQSQKETDILTYTF